MYFIVNGEVNISKLSPDTDPALITLKNSTLENDNNNN